MSEKRTGTNLRPRDVQHGVVIGCGDQNRIPESEEWAASKTIRGMFSYDDGKTWDTQNVHVLRDLDFPSDMGYPAAIETAPGEVFCIYYAVPGYGLPGYEELNMDEWGILSTRFRVG